MEPKQPFAIRILSVFAALASGGMFLSIFLAFYDIGPHLIGGERVTREDWLHVAAPLVAVIGVLMALIFYGFATRKPWSRHLVMTVSLLIIFYAIATGAVHWIRPIIMWRAIINASVLGGVSLWYFYFKPNVAAYFRALSGGRSPLS
jgi:hypothetical protein